MNPMCYHYLQSNPELARFVRSNPIWYRYLSRDPNRMYELPKESKVFYGKTLPQRIEKVNSQIEMFGMLIHLAKALKD